MSVVEVLLALRADLGRKDARGLQAAEVAEALKWFVLFVCSVFLLCVPSPQPSCHRRPSNIPYCIRMASPQKGARALLPLARACGTH